MNSKFSYGGLGARSYASLQDAKNYNCVNMDKSMDSCAINKGYNPVFEKQGIEIGFPKSNNSGRRSVNSIKRELMYLNGIDSTTMKRPSYSYEDDLS